MYEQFFKLKEKPFSLLPDASFLYLSDKHRSALTLIEYGLKSKAGFTVLTGNIGSGKTTLIREVLGNLEDDITVGLLNNTMGGSGGEMMEWVLMAFGVDYKGLSRVEAYESLINFLIAEYAKNKRIVLMIDEAQNMSPGALEELRMISNINADKDQILQILMVGQPELREKLLLPELEQFAQRISVHHHLEVLSKDEVADYINHRLKTAGAKRSIFDDLAIVAVWYHSCGVPRVINNLCDVAMVYAYAEEQKNIDAKIIYDVVKDRQVGGLKYRRSPTGNSKTSKANPNQLGPESLNPEGLNTDNLDPEDLNPVKIVTDQV